MANVPRGVPACDRIGVVQHDRRPAASASVLHSKLPHLASCAISRDDHRRLLIDRHRARPPIRGRGGAAVDGLAEVGAGDWARRHVGPSSHAGSTSRMLQWQPLEASLTSGAQRVQDDRQVATQRRPFRAAAFPRRAGSPLAFDPRCQCSGHTTSRHARSRRTTAPPGSRTTETSRRIVASEPRTPPAHDR